MKINSNASPNMNMLNDEDQFVVYRRNELASLYEMASCRVALAVWTGYVSRLKYASPIKNYKRIIYCPSLRNFGIFNSFEEDTEQLIEDLRLPLRIEATLKISLKKIHREMKKCGNHFASFINRHSGNKLFCWIFRFDVSFCFWLPNGKIDYQRTAKKIISVKKKRLNVVQKFMLTWDCCLEDEARIMLLNENIGAAINSFRWPRRRDDNDQRRIAQWWLAYLRDEPESYVLQWEVDKPASSWPFASIANNCCESHSWCRTSGIRINHFWRSLTDDDQVLAVYKMISDRISSSHKKWLILELLISSMSSEQQRSLLSMPNAAFQIVRASWNYSPSSDCMLWAWKYCREFVDGKDFIEIVSTGSVPDGNESTFHLSNLVELWDAAYDYHKDHFMIVKNKWDFFKSSKYRGYSYRDLTPAAYELFKRYVAEIESPEERVSFILEHSIDFARDTVDPDSLKPIFYSHLPCPKDRLKFKERVLASYDIKWRFAEFWRGGNFDALDANLKFYLDDDENAVRAYLQKLSTLLKLNSWKDDGSYKGVITDSDKWIKFSKSIDEIFAHDPAEALIIKKEAISRFLLCNGNHATGHFFHHSEIVLSQAFNTIETVYQDREELNRLKSQFLDERTLILHYCYDVYIHKVIEWCCNDNAEAIVKFKQLFESPNDIFDLVFFHLNKSYVTEGKGLKKWLLRRLDKYLSWYLVDEQQVNEYKLRRLNKSRRLIMPDRLEIISTISRAKDEPSYQVLIEWFSKDAAMVRKFVTSKGKVSKFD